MAVAEAELADWRRRVSELYAAVRARDDPECAHALWRPGRDALFRAHPQSPLPPGDPLRETGVPPPPTLAAIGWRLFLDRWRQHGPAGRRP
jgi:uncharacterized protein